MCGISRILSMINLKYAEHVFGDIFNSFNPIFYTLHDNELNVVEKWTFQQGFTTFSHLIHFSINKKLNI